MKRLSVILLSFLLYLPLCAQFKGTVYVDTNQSGTFDKGDKPLAGVMVTDGMNVVKTDKKGRFSLSGFKKTRFISITTPAGFETQQFYLPVKEDRKSYDFIVTESERTKTREHSFIHITDTEVTGGVGRWVTDLQQYIKNEQPAFLIHTGDICYEPGLTVHNQIVNAQTMDCPVYYCIGNHDLVKGNYGEELYESIYGPTWYSFDVGNVHYVVTPIDRGDNPTDYTQRDVYNWLKNDLALMKKDQALVLFNHDLFTPGDNFVFKADEKDILDLRTFNTKAQIYGHMHYNYVRNQKGIYTICTGTLDKGGIDHSPSSFRDIKIDANDHLTTQLRYTFIEPQIAIVSPMKNQAAPIHPETGYQLPVSVNTYNSQAKTSSVSYLLSNPEDNREIAKGNLSPLTDWNWSGNIQIPANENGKKLNLTVTSSFNDGKEATATSQFLYQKDFKSTAITGKDWNTLLQNASHSGGINDSQIKLPLQLQWTANTGSNIFMASPLIVGQKVFIATTDDNTSLNTYICAFDFHSGKQLWKFRTENSVKNTIACENEIVVAQDACLLVAILDHLIIDLVKLGAVGVKVNGFRLVSLTAHGGVSALLIQRQLRDGQLFAVQLRHCTAVQFLVSTGQGIFLFLQFDHPVVHAQHQVAQAGQNAGTERFFQRFGVRVGKNRLRNIACCIADRRAGCIKPFLFPAPIFIAGILGIMDGCQAGCRVVMGHHGVFFAVKLYQFFAALGSGHLFGILFALGQNLIQVRAFVLHF